MGINPRLPAVWLGLAAKDTVVEHAVLHPSASALETSSAKKEKQKKNRRDGPYRLGHYLLSLPRSFTGLHSTAFCHKTERNHAEAPQKPQQRCEDEECGGARAACRGGETLWFSSAITPACHKAAFTLSCL